MEYLDSEVKEPIEKVNLALVSYQLLKYYFLNFFNDGGQ